MHRGLPDVVTAVGGQAAEGLHARTVVQPGLADAFLVNFTSAGGQE